MKLSHWKEHLKRHLFFKAYVMHKLGINYASKLFKPHSESENY